MQSAANPQIPPLRTKQPSHPYCRRGTGSRQTSARIRSCCWYSLQQLVFHKRCCLSKGNDKTGVSTLSRIQTSAAGASRCMTTMATKVLPEESAAWLLLVQAIRLKAARFRIDLLAPPPPPPSPPASIAPKTLRRKKAKPRAEIIPPRPTPVEKQEMLTAGHKAVAIAKSCPEKTKPLAWIATIQAELERTDNQLTTLEQIAQASCAPNEIKAQSWHNISGSCWQCAYE